MKKVCLYLLPRRFMEIKKSQLLTHYVRKKTDGKVGIEETDIPTIILAEAGSAREGVELLLDIYDDYGCYFCSGVFVCDQNEVWYIENCSGTQYVALKLNDDMTFFRAEYGSYRAG